ncbi:MAG TPA: hypothetical protein VLV88_10460 [Terriglobales bacterium]|nr:hypothetical protein [Terriglobales bacterium]
MQCPVCGQDYGLTHHCAGIAPMTIPEETAPPPGLRFDPVYYFREAFRILRWDDAAVRRASRDDNSLLYGFLILALAPAFPLGVLTLRIISLGRPVPWTFIAIQYVFILIFSFIWIVLQIGLAHVLAKAFFGAKGSYAALLRAFLLGQLYQWLAVVPIVGGLLSGIAGIAVLMLVFEEVDGIERMKAFGLAAGIGVVFWILSVWITMSRMHPIR